MEPPTIADLIESLEGQLRTAQQLNANDQPTRSRELSLAITKIEEAIHWIRAISG